jgi:hypothetical protein
MIVEEGATSQPKRSDGGALAADDPTQRLQSRAHGLRVELGVQRGQPRLVELRAKVEEAVLAAEEHDADVQSLAALHPRHDAQQGVGERLGGIGLRRGHGGSPRRRGGARRAAR